MVKEMLSVLMDGIKDADMIMEYAEKAKAMEDDTYEWFMQHAKMRVESLSNDYRRINDEIFLEAKAADGDPIAEALKCHLKDQIMHLKNKLSNM